MPPPIIVAALALLLGPPGGARPALSEQPAQSQSDSQTGQSESRVQQKSQASQPCVSADSRSTKTADCKSAASAKRKKHQPPDSTSSASQGPTKTVVRNGSTVEPTVAISPGMSNQEVSQELNSTNQLLASADANLKQIANQQLDSDQQDTVRQIKSYMEQARTAAANGEAQRAYTLANKANLLSADLARPHR